MGGFRRGICENDTDDTVSGCIRREEAGKGGCIGLLVLGKELTGGSCLARYIRVLEAPCEFGYDIRAEYILFQNFGTILHNALRVIK